MAPMLLFLLFTGKPLLNYFYFVLLWPNRPVVLKLISGLALFKVQKFCLVCLEVLLVTWEANSFFTLHFRGVCMCYSLRFQVHAVIVQDLLFLVLHRISRSLSCVLLSSLLVSCRILSLCFLFFLFFLKFIMEVCSPLKKKVITVYTVLSVGMF